MNLQVMQALESNRAFLPGTSQGGWVCVRMALLAPKQIASSIPLGTSLDSNTERSPKLGC